jgi:DNA-directed RNA polymerase I subunit RPA1
MRECFLELQVSQLMDSTSSENRDSMQGVRQLLEKKEGLFRMNMMGKRVNFAARSVISPDPYIGTGEIGVPPFFAQRLSFPEPVTVHNIEIMRELVMNGTEVYPGAVAVEDTGKGVVVLLTNKRAAQREAIAKQLLQSGTAQGEAVRWGQNARGKAMRPGHTCKIVYRHLQDGDVLLTNRQPTLHKTSAFCVSNYSSVTRLFSQSLTLLICNSTACERVG